MKPKEFKRINFLLFILVLILITHALSCGKTPIAFLAVGAFMFVASLLKTRVQGVLADERQIQVSQKAAEVSFKVLMPILLLSSIGLLAGGGNQQFHYVKALGIILAYITILATVIYRLTYWYFNKKTTG